MQEREKKTQQAYEGLLQWNNQKMLHCIVIETIMVYEKVGIYI